MSGAVLAGNVTQPESVAGSIELYLATMRESWVPRAPQDGRRGPALLLLQALASSRLPMTAAAEILMLIDNVQLRG